MEHIDAPLEERHAPNNWEYADATARLAASGFIAADVGRVALQLDDNSYWTLTNHSPIAWVSFTAAHEAAADPHAGIYEPADATILKDSDIGVSVAAEGHNHAGTYEPADATILKDADIGVTVQSIDTARIAGSTYSTVQHVQDLFRSAGWTSGGVISDAGSGAISVTAGTGLIRATDSDVATIYFCDWAASSPANVVLVDASVNYVYVEYNAGAPRVIATTSERTDTNTNFLIGIVYRSGTTLHINDKVKLAVSDHAGKMIAMNQETMPYANGMGGMLSGTGTRNIAISAGAFWMSLIRFTTPAFDSSAAGTFTYYYRNGVGGWTTQTAQTQINNTQYDNGTGTLATLTNNKYGVHWVYMETDGAVAVLFGQADRTLTEAQDAQPPSSIPPQLSSTAFLVGKIIIQKSASVFSQVESAFMSMFTGSLAADHGNLTGLGDDDHPQYPLKTTVIGKSYLGYWPAAAIKPATTNGCAALAWAESTTNKVMTGYLAFDAAAIEYSSISFKAPQGLDESAGFIAKIEWTEASGASSHDCVWQVEIQAQGDADTIDSAWGTAVTVTDTGTSGTRRATAETSTITAGGTWAAGDQIIVRVSRKATDGSDTLNVDAYLIGVTLYATNTTLVEP